jgi:hypothetical protein
MTERINSIKWVLVDLIYELCGAARIYRDYKEVSNNLSEDEVLSIVRVCQTSSIISLSRLWELLKEFGKEVNETPEPLRTKLLALKKEIEDRKIYQFRSKYIGHIIDEDKSPKDTIKVTDIEPRLAKIIQGDW